MSEMIPKYNAVSTDRVVATIENIPIAFMGLDNKIRYDKEKISEMVAGSQGGKFTITSVKPTYQFDSNRKANNDLIYSFFKQNTLMQNRVRIVNSLVFGRGFTYSYDNATKIAIDRFWAVNKFRPQLNKMGTDLQLYGDVFLGLFPQDTGDVLVGVYHPSSVDIDFNPINPSDINHYYVSYRNEETNKDETFQMYPIEKFIRDVEYDGPISGTVRKVKKLLSGNPLPGGMKGCMVHISANATSSEIHGTSDFRQSYGPLNDYMDFVGDRLNIHQIYGSPMIDIEIDTDDQDKIDQRIEELIGFQFGSNPVHNKQETWTPLELKINAAPAQHDEKVLRGLICAGTGIPEHLLFNQIEDQDESGTFVLNKMAEDIQDSFGDAIIDVHKFVAYMASIDMINVTDGQIIFPEISTMSEKLKAETYVLKVGAKICSRKTASYNTGHNWDTELVQIQEEMAIFEDPMDDPNMAGIIGGRESSRINNQDPNRDDGLDDKNARQGAKNVNDQTFGEGVTND